METVRDRTVEILTEARELIRPPSCWTRRAHARDKVGIAEFVSPWTDTAVCWCADGALRKVVHDLDLTSDEGLNALATAQAWLVAGFRANEPNRERLADDLWAWNDETSHAGVVNAFTKAIELVKVAEA